MKRLLLIIVLLISTLPANAKEPVFRNIFITDTSEAEEYLIPDSVTLKGYAQFLEDSDAIYLKDDENQFVLNLKKPQKITSDTLTGKHDNSFVRKPKTFSKSNSDQYSILEEKNNITIDFGENFSAGTSYGSEVDYAQFKRKAGIFTRYDVEHFALRTSYERSFGSAFGDYTDYIYVVPELKINNILSLKEVLSANPTYKVNKAEFVLSINPLARTKMRDNRLNIEMGTVHVYDQKNTLLKNQIKFNTKFKL